MEDKKYDVINEHFEYIELNLSDPSFDPYSCDVFMMLDPAGSGKVSVLNDNVTEQSPSPKSDCQLVRLITHDKHEIKIAVFKSIGMYIKILDVALVYTEYMIDKYGNIFRKGVTYYV